MVEPRSTQVLQAEYGNTLAEGVDEQAALECEEQMLLEKLAAEEVKRREKRAAIEEQDERFRELGVIRDSPHDWTSKMDALVPLLTRRCRTLPSVSVRETVLIPGAQRIDDAGRS